MKITQKPQIIFSNFDWKESPNIVINTFVTLSKTKHNTHVPLPDIGDDQYYVASYDNSNYTYTTQELVKEFEEQRKEKHYGQHLSEDGISYCVDCQKYEENK